MLSVVVITEPMSILIGEELHGEFKQFPEKPDHDEKQPALWKEKPEYKVHEKVRNTPP
jgi:hypothetical protein